MEKNSSILIAGARGLVGSAIMRRFQAAGHTGLIPIDRQEVNLLDQAAVSRLFTTAKPEYAILAAAKVGGILANATQQADYLYENLTIATQFIHAAAEHGVKKLLFMGSSCIYPRLAQQPLREDSLLTGALEPTNEGFAISKLAGLKLCEMYQRQYGKKFVSVLPTNLYGPGDNFHPTDSHVIPGMMRRFHEAKVAGATEVTVWGTGTPRREFMHVDDLADALYFIMEKYDAPQTINIGTGEECTMRELAEAMKEAVGFRGELHFDPGKPDGVPRKFLDSARIRALGWTPKHHLRDGLAETYRWALEQRMI